MAALTDSPGRGSNCLWVLVVVLGFCAGVRADGFAGGTGTREDPYQIATAEQLISLGADPNLLTKHFVLVADIDLKPGGPGGKTFAGAVIAAIPAAGGRAPATGSFTGSFDGSNHTIANLTIRHQGVSQSTGLFESISSAGKVFNLVLEQVDVQCPFDSTVGALVGNNLGVIANCRVSGNVSGVRQIGGLAGYNSGTIRGCGADCQVAGLGCLGGLVGQHIAGTIECCMAQGTVTAANPGDTVGGLIGYSDAAVVNCYAAGFVAGGYYVGGLLGQSTGPVRCCYACGPVIGIWDVMTTGGLVGRTWEADLIEACYFLPGLGDLSWNNGVGTPLTDEQMRDRASFAGWDFAGQLTDGLAEAWMMPAEGGYPVLSRLSGYVPPRPPGSGTAGDPYQLSRTEDLSTMIWVPDLHYRLMADIDLAGLSFTGPVVSSFTGRLNGACHSILNLCIKSGAGGSGGQDETVAAVDHVGFFGVLGTQAVIENLCLENASLEGKPNVSHLGILAGTNAGLVRNCRVTGAVAGRDYVGGLVGRNAGVLWACSADVSVDGRWYVGGLVGQSSGVVACACVHGSVRGTNYLGGLIGSGSSNGLIFQCYSTAPVAVISSPESASGAASTAGALIGYRGGVLLVDSYYLLQPGAGVPDNGLGTPLSLSQLQDPANFTGWDFFGDAADGTWDWWLMKPNAYPVPSWQADSTPSGLTARLAGEPLDDSLARMVAAGSALGEIRYDFDGVIPAGHVIYVRAGGGSAMDVLVSLGAYSWDENSGDGSPASPYQIATAGQLDSLSVCPALWDRCFVLGGDIDLSGRYYAGPVLAPDTSKTASEFQGTTFTGRFEGQGHAVAGLTVVSSSNYAGLFGYIGPQGAVSGLMIEDAFVAGSVGPASARPSGRTRCGTATLAGENTGTVEDCSCRGTVLGTSEVGGLVGHDRGSLVRCASYATAVGYRQVGGLVGISEGWLFACHADGRVLASGDLGGLAGYNTGTISQCQATGSVETPSSYGGTAGGLVGDNRGTVADCFSTATVAADSYYAGGLVGSNQGGISRCYSTGPVQGSGARGGLVASNPGTVSLSFWDAQTSGVAVSAGGLGRTTAEMQLAESFVGWGGGIWGIDDAGGYPQLLWTGSGGMPMENVPQRTYGGSGDPNAPFILTTAEDLVCLTARADDWTRSFVLADDIDMAGVNLAAPIGTFAGVLDGKGHSIRNLALARPAGPVGLIDCLRAGIVRNLQLVNADIQGGGARIGMLASEARNATISCCRVTGQVSVGDGVRHVAGLVGDASSTTVIRCGVEANIAAGSRCQNVGGLAGHTSGGVIRDCYARGAITGMDVCQYLGGLVGYREGGVCERCYAAVALAAGPDSTSLGGIAGTDAGDPDTCYPTGCVWDKDVAPQARGACGRTTAAMYDLHTYLDRKWDFAYETKNGVEDIWTMPAGGGYPELTCFLRLPEMPVPSGAGTPEDPYRIGAAADLLAIHRLDWSGCYRLTADIDLAGTAWVESPIPALYGTFDGAGHKISHLTIQGGSHLGVFGMVDEGGTVKDLVLDSIRITSSPGGRYLGSLTGENRGRILNCHVRGCLTGGPGSQYVGGLAGLNSGTIETASADVNIAGETGCQHLGGLVGYSSGTVTECYATGTVAGEGQSTAVGGLIGSNTGTVEICYAQCSVAGDSGVGGLVGVSAGPGHVWYCYCTGPVAAQTEAGGLIGRNSAEATSCFWDTDRIDLPTDGVGIGKSTRQMSEARTYRGWGDLARWTLDAGQDYPRLRWQGAPGVLLDGRPIPYAKGQGTADDPFVIETADQFVEIAYHPDDWDQHFAIVADLDFGVLPPGELIPIGTESRPFTGVCEAKGHVLSNITLSFPYQNHVGLFAYIKDDPNVAGDTGRIWGVMLRQAHLRGKDSVGGMAGTNEGYIVGCAVDGSVTGEANVGGLAGTNQAVGQVVWCRGDALVQGQRSVGGIVGLNNAYGAIAGCYTRGKVEALQDVGGLVGRADGGALINSYSISQVLGEKGAGGLIGTGAMWVHLSYWDVAASTVAVSAGGVGKTTADLMRRDTFAGWSVGAGWFLQDGLDYPRLAWEHAPGQPIVSDPTRYAGGSGQADDPYRIETVTHLAAVWKHLEDYDKCFRLQNDLLIPEDRADEVQPVGILGVPFTGVFDGGNHAIKGWRCISRMDETGFFGTIGDTGVVRDLHLVDVNVAGGWNVGGLAGCCRGAVEHCTVAGQIRGQQNVGGVAGWLSGTGTLRNSSATVAAVRGNFAGALVGVSQGTVATCFGRGEVAGEAAAGGLLGGSDGGSVTDCGATANAKTARYVGGLIGQATGAHITRCYAAGRSEGWYRTGGLVGLDENSVLTSCFYDCQKTPDWSAGARSTTEMSWVLTFTEAGWDFENVWMICPGENSPMLIWEQERCR